MAALASQGYDAGGGFGMFSPGDLRSSNLTHGVVEGGGQNLDEEVNGVASHVAFRPAPIGFFNDETREGR